MLRVIRKILYLKKKNQSKFNFLDFFCAYNDHLKKSVFKHFEINQFAQPIYSSPCLKLIFIY
jgi:hypothetical protein